jgi:toxin-antitoxin system PIN domain toxin
VIAIDTNLLVYAHREESPFYTSAEASIRSLAESSMPWAIPWPCIHEFLAIVTHHRIFNPPTPLARALEQVDAWASSPSLAFLSEETAYWTKLRHLLKAGRVLGPQIHDARVAALCVHHGVTELWSADRDFNRYPDLAVRNPLINK